MTLNNGKITPPISTDDVRTALGETSNDLGTLCRSGNINPWSRYKPARVKNKLTELSESEFAGPNSNWGLKIVNTVTGAELNNTLTMGIDKIKSIVNYNWVFDSPYHLQQEYYRLTDFNGYYHDAQPFLFPSRTSYSVNVFNGKTTLGIEMLSNNDSGDISNLITYNQLSNAYFLSGVTLGTWYFAVAAVRNNGSSFTLFKANSNIQNGGFEIDIPVAANSGLNTLGLGTYYLYSFLIDNRGENIMPLPNYGSWKGLSMLTVESKAPLTFTLQKIGSLMRLYSNNDLRESGGNVNNYQLPSYYDNDQQGNVLQVYQYKNLCFKVSVYANESFTVNRGNFVIAPDNDNRTYPLQVQLETDVRPLSTGNITFRKGTTTTLYLIGASGEYAKADCYGIKHSGMEIFRTPDLIITNRN